MLYVLLRFCTNEENTCFFLRGRMMSMQTTVSISLRVCSVLVVDMKGEFLNAYTHFCNVCIDDKRKIKETIQQISLAEFFLKTSFFVGAACPFFVKTQARFPSVHHQLITVLLVLELEVVEIAELAFIFHCNKTGGLGRERNVKSFVIKRW